MARMGRLLAVLTLGGVLLFSPAAGGAAPAEAAPAPTAVVAQAEPSAPPGPDLNGDRQSAAEDKQRLVTGITGIVLIAAVLLSRKARKRPVFSFKWKN